MSVCADDNLSRCVSCDELFWDEALTERGDDLWCRHCIEDEESPGVAAGERQSGESPVSDGGRKANAPVVIPELPGCDVCDDPDCMGCCEVCNDPECYRNKGSRKAVA